MSLKIQFESSVSGFERVEKALTTQKQLIDESAAAMNRLSQAKGNMAKEDLQVRGMENLKSTASGIKDLVSALDVLTKSQSGLSGFMSIFGGFNKQIAEFSSMSAGQVMNTMVKQMDVLKASIAAASSQLKAVQTETKAHEDAGRSKEAAAASERAATIGSNLLGQQALLGQLQMQAFLRTPLLSSMGIMPPPGAPGAPTAGFFGPGGPGGLTPMGMLGMVGRGLSIPFTARLLASGTEMALNRVYADDRTEQSLFQREMGIAGGALQGNVGRQFMLSQGIGREAAFMRNPTGEFNRPITATTALESARLGLRWLGHGGTKTLEELAIERGGELSALDEKQRFGIDRATQLTLGIARDPRARQIAMLRGDEAIMARLQGLRGGIPGLFDMTGLPTERGLTRISEMERAGILDIQGRTGTAGITDLDAERVAGAAGISKLTQLSGVAGRIGRQDRMMEFEVQIQNERDRLKDVEQRYETKVLRSSLGLERATELFGVSDATQQMLFRQRYYRPDTALELGRALGAQGQVMVGGQPRTGFRTLGAQQMFEQFAAGLQPEVGAANIQEITAVQSRINKALSEPQPGTGMGALSPEDAVKASVATQQYVQSAMSQGGNIFSMGTDRSMISMGVRNPVERQILLRLMDQGRQEDVAGIISERTGRSLASVKESLNVPVVNAQRIQERIATGGVPADEMNAPYIKRFGVSFTAAAQAGDPTKALAAGMTAYAAGGAGIFTEANVRGSAVVPELKAANVGAPTTIPVSGLTDPLSTMEGAKGPIGTFIKPTVAAQLETKQAQGEQQLIEGMRALERDIGTEFNRIIMDQMVQGFDKMANGVRESFEALKNRQTEKSEKETESVDPFKGIRGMRESPGL